MKSIVLICAEMDLGCKLGRGAFIGKKNQQYCIPFPCGHHYGWKTDGGHRKKSHAKIPWNTDRVLAALKRIVSLMPLKRGIETLTVYAFSTEKTGSVPKKKVKTIW